MMIKCYCVRESSKEGLISFIVRKGSTGPPAPNSKAGLTGCMLGGGGVPGSRVGEDDRDRDPSPGPTWTTESMVEEVLRLKKKFPPYPYLLYGSKPINSSVIPHL